MGCKEKFDAWKKSVDALNKSREANQFLVSYQTALIKEGSKNLARTVAASNPALAALGPTVIEGASNDLTKSVISGQAAAQAENPEAGFGGALWSTFKHTMLGGVDVVFGSLFTRKAERLIGIMGELEAKVDETKEAFLEYYEELRGTKIIGGDFWGAALAANSVMLSSIPAAALVKLKIETVLAIANPVKTFKPFLPQLDEICEDAKALMDAVTAENVQLAVALDLLEKLVELINDILDLVVDLIEELDSWLTFKANFKEEIDTYPIIKAHLDQLDSDLTELIETLTFQNAQPSLAIGTEYKRSLQRIELSAEIICQDLDSISEDLERSPYVQDFGLIEALIAGLDRTPLNKLRDDALQAIADLRAAIYANTDIGNPDSLVSNWRANLELVLILIGTIRAAVGGLDLGWDERSELTSLDPVMKDSFLKFAKGDIYKKMLLGQFSDLELQSGALKNAEESLADCLSGQIAEAEESGDSGKQAELEAIRDELQISASGRTSRAVAASRIESNAGADIEADNKRVESISNRLERLDVI